MGYGLEGEIGEAIMFVTLQPLIMDGQRTGTGGGQGAAAGVFKAEII